VHPLDILGEKYQMYDRHIYCVKFEGLVLQVPPDKHQYYFVGVKGRVHRYSYGHLSLYYNPRKPVSYETLGKQLPEHAHMLHNMLTTNYFFEL
jgi:hypothetical protein